MGRTPNFGAVTYGYDAVGNVIGYTSRNAAESGSTYYQTTAARYDGYKDGTTVGTRDTGKTLGLTETAYQGTSVSQYDGNGFLIGIDDKKNPFDRVLYNDVAGRVLQKVQEGRGERA